MNNKIYLLKGLLYFKQKSRHIHWYAEPRTKLCMKLRKLCTFKCEWLPLLHNKNHGFTMRVIIRN